MYFGNLEIINLTEFWIMSLHLLCLHIIRDQVIAWFGSKGHSDSRAKHGIMTVEWTMMKE